jgi:hypothetical protein
MWLKDANCFGTRTWSQALSDANGLADLQCGLDDDSVAGDWRLPNVKELDSLIDFAQCDPALPSGHPFNNVQNIYYWSSTTHEYNPNGAWGVNVYFGSRGSVSKAYYGYYVWPVRGGN